MKQPDLGKRIAELRKAKGLTQDELVQKCNLNVRTLQRIESGEVTPRSYTIRLIFTALEYDIHGTAVGISNRFFNSRKFVSSWLGKGYKNFLELFNFNTHPVKKILTVSSLAVILAASLFFMVILRIQAHDKQVIRQKLLDTCSNSKFVQRFNTGQIDSISIHYMEHACMMADNSQTTYDRESIQRHFKKLYDRGLRFSKLQSTFLVIDDCIAVDRGEWSVSLESVVVATGTYMTQWRYIDGKWLGENEMSKSDVPAESQTR